MKKMKASVVNKKDLKNCWILEGKIYTHTNEIRTGGLPYVNKEDECVLKDSGIPYRPSVRYGKSVLEYWNPECMEEKEVEAPLYAFMFGQYRYLNKNHKQVIPSDKMIKMAQEMRETVSKKVEEYHAALKMKKLHREAKAALDGSLARYKEVKHRDYFATHDIQLEGDNIKCFPVVDAKGNYLNGVVFFDMNKVRRGGYVTLQVPEEMVGWIKGRHGGNIHQWASEIEVERINLVS